MLLPAMVRELIYYFKWQHNKKFIQKKKDFFSKNRVDENIRICNETPANKISFNFGFFELINDLFIY